MKMKKNRIKLERNEKGVEDIYIQWREEEKERWNQVKTLGIDRIRVEELGICGSRVW
jgi:hypothetical protein